MIEIQVNPVRLELAEEQSVLLEKVATMLKIPQDEAHSFQVKRMSLDARKKSDIYFSCSVRIHVSEKLLKTVLRCKYAQIITKIEQTEQKFGSRILHNRPVIVGAGPCGLFCAWLLAKNGYQPIIIERGKKVEQRIIDVEKLFLTGALDENSNVVFGEGGAGTFSDGKLTSRSKDKRSDQVLELFIKCGAPAEIAYMAKPHIGSDRLRAVLIRLRNEIEALGGTFLFEHQLKQLQIQNNMLKGVILRGSEFHALNTELCILAIGHSARDTFEQLFDQGVAMEAKNFAVGLRIEHPQEMIDQIQYGNLAGNSRLDAAEYQLTAQIENRGIYTFCMCPGGSVICSANQQGFLAVNGMSKLKRNDVNANSAVVAQVSTDDFGTHPLDGMRFQMYYEKRALSLGGKDFVAPAQTVGDFLNGQATTSFIGIKPSYLPGVMGTDLTNCLPSEISKALRAGIVQMGRQLKGFDRKDAVLTGIETRTSSPIRILRNQEGQSITYQGVYPAGEGAGYAGGIMSAAIDGLNTAQKIMETYAIPK